MKRLDNKGQTLVLFVLLLPLFMLALAFIVDIGNLYLKKRNIEQNLEYIIDYGIKNIDSIKPEFIREYLYENVHDLKDEYVEIKSDYLKITVISETNGNFYDFFKIGEKNIKITYEAKVINGNIEINRSE